MKVPGFKVDLPPIDENTPQKEILDGLIETYEKIRKNVNNVKTNAEKLKTECDDWSEDEMRAGFKEAMGSLLGMADALDYAYDHVRIVSVLLRVNEGD